MPSREETVALRAKVKEFVAALQKQVGKAQVFVGGSFAKGTLVKKEKYDVDVFVRFSGKGDFVGRLEKVVGLVAGKLSYSVTRLHGSRDYFEVAAGEGLVFEVVPVEKVARPALAENVTDLSYFHVNWVAKALRADRNLGREIALAKTFTRAQGVYGAESYIQGLSGYALECLVIYYGSFEKMAKALVKVKKGERLVLDPAKLYRSKSEIGFALNEARQEGPLVIVDPTWKERNAGAALSFGAFEKLQAALRAFLKRPSVNHFEKKGLNVEGLARLKGELVALHLETDRQAGDIAGTKLKKFALFVESVLGQYFEVRRSEFVYSDEQSADVYFVLEPRKEVLRRGPRVSMKDAVGAFQKANSGSFERGGFWWVKEDFDRKGSAWLRNWLGNNKKLVGEMGLTKTSVREVTSA